MTDVTRNATAATEPLGWRRSEVRRPWSAGAGEDPASDRVVLIADHQADVQLDSGRYRDLVQRVLEAEGVPPGAETAVTFVGPEEMAHLNETHMGNAGPTDVLAFPIDLPERAHASRDARGEARDRDVADATAAVLAGDVVVCPAVAAANAAAGKGSREGHDGSVAAEIDLLVVHGVLHLLGMDHAKPAEAAAMRARENEHLQALWSSS